MREVQCGCFEHVLFPARNVQPTTTFSDFDQMNLKYYWYFSPSIATAVVFAAAMRVLVPLLHINEVIAIFNIIVLGCFSKISDILRIITHFSRKIFWESDEFITNGEILKAILI